ncbi:helix-turn-helix domain-containing protein [Mycobacterium avium]|uniref:helix-turn-helix domain-containing protein n=1 Tax=Mycobacterium avium TaxID=1764 RepID=UPI001157B910|nr:helix-turn-helix domain-containing protein [Mycobacterium avium]
MDELTEVFKENNALRGENERLKAQLGEAIQSFGVPQRVIVGGHAAGANRPNKKKLTKREVAEIRRLGRTTGMSQRELADIYDINKATVCRILKGVYHK